jgi:hypothetical protein
MRASGISDPGSGENSAAPGADWKLLSGAVKIKVNLNEGGSSVTDLRRPVTLYPDDVRNVRAVGGRGVALIFEMPFNDTSDRIREGGQVNYAGALYEVTRREDLRPPIVAERTIEFSLRPVG